MQRRLVVPAALTALLLLASTAHAADPPPTTDHLRAFGVVPPGQNGFVSLSDALGSTTQPHFRDQLDMYAGLIEDDDVSEEELSTYFKSFQFGPGATVEREYSLGAGLTIFRDNFGVPHIYGATDLDAFFGTGYATAEDRLWQMDVFRHAATGRLAELPPLGEGYLATDKQTRTNGYTPAELDAMLAALPPVAGVPAVDIISAYVDGINARIAEIVGNINLIPAEYQGYPISEWTAADVAAVAVFQLRSFGETGGAELEHAAYLQGLRKELGKKKGNKVFRDLSYRSDPDSYTSIPADVGEFPSQDFGPRDSASIALPDNSKQYLRAVASQAKAERALHRLIGLPTRQSNFAAVGPELSASGNPLEFGAPQVGYQVPQFFLELDVHSPNFDYRGPAVPGASVLIPLGRGIDYAWSLTTGAADNVDTRVELLCQEDEHYMFNGECIPMDKRTESFSVVGNPVPEDVTVYRTVHGPVIAFGTVNDEPVAIVKERAFWMGELDTIVAFAKLNSNQTRTPEDFFAALEGASMSFNSVFANHDHLAYMHAGWYPNRATGADPFLPTWGTGEWEWDGLMAASSLPRMVDPPMGWVVNWNNRPSVGWKDGDSSGWGATHRVGMLAEALGARADGAILSDVVDAIRVVATQDARAYFLGPKMSSMTADMKGNVGSAADAFASWVDEGSHRIDMDDDGNQDHGTAVAVFDVWYRKLVHRVFDDELGAALDLSVLPISDDPTQNNGSSHYSDFSTYLWHLLQGDDFLDYDYCDNIDTEEKESCRKQVRRALEKAAGSVSQDQGDAPGSWTAPIEKLHFDELGAKSVPDVDWQNRGTWNHAVEVTGSR